MRETEAKDVGDKESWAMEGQEKSHKARRGSAEQIKERTHALYTRLPDGEQRT